MNFPPRLQSLASPGTIFVSAAVRDEMGEPEGYAFTDRGELSLKNIARPVRVYEIIVDAAGHVRTQMVRERWRVVGRRRNGGPIDVTLDAAALATAEGIIVGRVPDQCHLTVDDISVSRRHFRLRQLSPEMLAVEDLGSTNGTFVAGRRLTIPSGGSSAGGGGSSSPGGGGGNSPGGGSSAPGGGGIGASMATGMTTPSGAIGSPGGGGSASGGSCPSGAGASGAISKYMCLENCLW